MEQEDAGNIAVHERTRACDIVGGIVVILLAKSTNDVQLDDEAALADQGRWLASRVNKGVCPPQRRRGITR